MDKIKIENLEVFANHGVFPEETKLGQKFLLDMELYVDTRKAGLSDDLTQSVHYGEVSHFAVRFMREHTYRLIESAAEHLAEALLLGFPGLWRVCLEVKKPWAPIGLPLESVSVEIDRSWHRVYLSLGSNMGDRRAYLEGAVRRLEECRECKVRAVSDWIETEPYGDVEQEKFLNGCVEMDTLFTPGELLDLIHGIEAEAGRVRTVRWGPRTLDLDILFYDREVIGTKDLAVPHEDLANREFVLRPLMMIAPYLRHPVTQKTAGQMLRELEEKK